MSPERNRHRIVYKSVVEMSGPNERPTMVFNTWGERI